MTRKIIQIFYHKREDIYGPKNKITGEYEYTLTMCCLCDDGTVWCRLDGRVSEWVPWAGLEVVEESTGEEAL